jgi:hypothetical protein
MKMSTPQQPQHLTGSPQPSPLLLLPSDSPLTTFEKYLTISHQDSSNNINAVDSSHSSQSRSTDEILRVADALFGANLLYGAISILDRCHPDSGSSNHRIHNNNRSIARVESPSQRALYTVSGQKPPPHRGGGGGRGSAHSSYLCYYTPYLHYCSCRSFLEKCRAGGISRTGCDEEGAGDGSSSSTHSGNVVSVGGVVQAFAGHCTDATRIAAERVCDGNLPDGSGVSEGCWSENSLLTRSRGKMRHGRLQFEEGIL